MTLAKDALAQGTEDSAASPMRALRAKKPVPATAMEEKAVVAVEQLCARLKSTVAVLEVRASGGGHQPLRSR